MTVLKGLGTLLFGAFPAIYLDFGNLKRAKGKKIELERESLMCLPMSFFAPGERREPG